MERLIDKGIIALCCLMTFLAVPVTALTIGAFLIALTIAALGEVLPRSWRRGIAVVFLVAALIWPVCAAFLPLIAYDCARDTARAAQWAWVVPLAAALREDDVALWGLIALACAGSVLLSRRTAALHRERERVRRIRDAEHEASLSLAARNRDLQEARELSAQVATLAERGRIAREIHDNVGHLLTRAIMQVEALKVVHADEPAIAEEHTAVSHTLNEAMQTVRASVHNLRDTATDPRDLLQAALDSCGLDQTSLTYEVEELPSEVTRCFVPIVREAATNTVRHSDATSIDVQVREYPGLFQLIVQDNGSKAAARRASGSGSGMGLQAMDERVRTLGGTLRTGWHDGFRVFASIPKTGT